MMDEVTSFEGTFGNVQNSLSKLQEPFDKMKFQVPSRGHHKSMLHLFDNFLSLYVLLSFPSRSLSLSMLPLLLNLLLSRS